MLSGEGPTEQVEAAEIGAPPPLALVVEADRRLALAVRRRRDDLGARLAVGEQQANLRVGRLHGALERLAIGTWPHDAARVPLSRSFTLREHARDVACGERLGRREPPAA